MKRPAAPERPRRTPKQARSSETVGVVLEAAARVFRREGWGATTNRIAGEAGVSIGTLYEYFPNKQALLVALARAHVDLAEREVGAALDAASTVDEMLAALQRAIVASQRFPSQALEMVESASSLAELRARVAALRETVLAALALRADGLPEPSLRARAVFGVVCELTARAVYETSNAVERDALLRHLWEMAVEHMRPRSSSA